MSVNVRVCNLKYGVENMLCNSENSRYIAHLTFKTGKRYVKSKLNL